MGPRRSFDEPDEVIELPRLRSSLVSLGVLSVAFSVHQPGWRWSVDVQPTVRTDRCETRHVGYCRRGRLAIELNDGTTFEIHPGDVYDVPPGHDGWVVGDEPTEMIDWVGSRSWLSALSTLHERILATIVVTDIVASTTTAHRLGASAWSDLITSYGSAMRDVITMYRGRTVKSTGDGLLAVFDGAARALRCADAMRAAAAGLDLVTRTAVHTGEVQVAEDDVHGLAVHESARMLELAAAGDILVSATTRMLSSDTGMMFTERREHLLRDLDGARAVFALG